MKLIKAPVIPPNTKVFDPSTVRSDHYYAVKTCIGGIGFITRPRFESGDFRIAANIVVTQGNGYLTSNSNLSALIQTLMDRGDEVHEFTTPKELWQWLADNS